MDDPLVRIGLLGCGNVGAAFANLVVDHADAVARRCGVRLEVAAIAVRDLSKERGVRLPASVFTTDSAAVVADPSIDLIVEVLGGLDPARRHIIDALGQGKPVVTANKELLAIDGDSLFHAAETAAVNLLFEAAVAGGIPLIRALRESLVGERIDRVIGIVNGTTNYILTQMTEHGTSYADALAEAQALGFAEADPTADVEGFDAGAKAAIIASIAFGARVVADDVFHEGISAVSASDIEYAARRGFRIKLLAICEQFDDDAVSVRVHPAMLPIEHPLASVSGSFNAVFVEGTAVGELMFYGRGAGGQPTASAVLGDVIDAAQHLVQGSHGSLGQLAEAKLRPRDELSSAFYLNLAVVDQPGVLASVAGVFATHGVSIRLLEQDGLTDEARIMFVTHLARESALSATLAELAALPVVRSVDSVLRVIDGAA